MNFAQFILHTSCTSIHPLRNATTGTGKTGATYRYRYSTGIGQVRHIGTGTVPA